MKAKINKNGVLEIERAGKYKKQSCRIGGFYNITVGYDEEAATTARCNDTCPLFGEPEDNYGGARLTLCHRELFFGEFTDERVSQ